MQVLRAGVQGVVVLFEGGLVVVRSKEGVGRGLEGVGFLEEGLWMCEFGGR